MFIYLYIYICLYIYTYTCNYLFIYSSDKIIYLFIYYIIINAIVNYHIFMISQYFGAP